MSSLKKTNYVVQMLPLVIVFVKVCNVVQLLLGSEAHLQKY